METWVPWVPQVEQARQELEVILAYREQLEPRVMLDLREQRVLRVLLATQEKRDHLDNRVPQVLQAALVSKAQQAS